MSVTTWSLGSEWLRWDPHLHAPGTLLNNQFGQNWDEYFERLATASPAPVALGITDYCTLRCYKEVRIRLKAGMLPQVKLVFPNIELRLTLETKTKQGVNLHFLVSPDDPDHVSRMEEHLSSLHFHYLGNKYVCSEDGLKRLGRAHKRDEGLADVAALQEGANQFKVDYTQLHDLLNDKWFRNNVLIAVAGGNDGLAGLAADSGFHAQRVELGRFAHIIFSATPSDRRWWLGEHEDFSSTGLTPKPCLHGSDAHSLDSVLVPAQARYCWIRAQATFDGLRQTLVEPARRVHIGDTPPRGPIPSDVIRALKIRNGPWAKTPEVSLNSGLVTIIGSKGSGKTALADLIALAAGARQEASGPASFFVKAEDLLEGLELELEWGDGEKEVMRLPDDSLDLPSEPRVRYLSQQFVEQLCSRTGLSEPLLDEIERVVFNAIPEQDRYQCLSFPELRDLMLQGAYSQREAERHIIRERTKVIAEEYKCQQSVEPLRKKLEETVRNRQKLEIDLKAIPLKADEAVIKAHTEATARLKQLKSDIGHEELKAKQLKDLQADFERHMRSTSAALDALKTKYVGILAPDVWEKLRLRSDPGAMPALEAALDTVTKRALSLRQVGALAPASDTGKQQQGLAFLEAEVERLTKALGLDQANVNKRLDLEKRLGSCRQAEERELKLLTHAEKAKDRIKAAAGDRLDAYERVFESLAAEEAILDELYEQLRSTLANEPKLGKLTFYVQRTIDLNSWAARGERLFDLRKPPFKGEGALAALAQETLVQTWRQGSPAAVRSAMGHFLAKYSKEALDARAQGVTPQEFGEWMFSTDHVSVRYGIRYEGVDLVHLSPGTRGVVLLMLYLALDEWDRRPLIIDQPEENLDPRSVFADLVPFFRDATARRQVIMVTHNANLVVNTDSDQVIVAEAHRTEPGCLPDIRYVAGGLEDRVIRDHVCEILEGGEEAFKRRSERYGVR